MRLAGFDDFPQLFVRLDAKDGGMCFDGMVPVGPAELMGDHRCAWGESGFGRLGCFTCFPSFACFAFEEPIVLVKRFITDDRVTDGFGYPDFQ